MNPRPLMLDACSSPRAGPDPMLERPFLNRELSWLQFNLRVLHEALDERTPLLERVRFLSIFNSNLDEFYQKRVGGLQRQIDAGVSSITPDGMTPRLQLVAIRNAIAEMLGAQADCYANVIRPALAREGIELLDFSQLTEAERQFARQYFRENLFPMLTPLYVDPGHPFPRLSNLSLSLGVILHPPDESAAPGDAGQIQFARVKVPRLLPRWVQLGAGLSREGGGSGVSSASDGGPCRFVHVVDIIRHNLGDLFEGMVIDEVMPFRITRNAEVERDEEDAEDLLDLIKDEVRDRRFARVIRMEVPQKPNQRMVRFLMDELDLSDADVYVMPGELDYTDLTTVANLHVPKLKYRPWTPVIPPRLADDEADIFSIIRGGDVLVHHPYESFGASVERFIRAAVNDPKVVAIKQTLYRTSKDSPFIVDLIHAAEAGKQVVCLVEIKARFDEERNIAVAEQLEKAGVHVVYGIVGLKTHTKTALVVRHEAEGMRVYAHIGTGNYNSDTARLYTDLGLFTCNPPLTADLVELFHYLTGRSIKKDFRRLLVAPTNMRRRFMEMIAREAGHAEQWQQRGGDPADPHRPHIIAKMNSLEDQLLCRALYDASQAGVRIELIVRGFCCLYPGVPGLSENISVQSVIGRFLEHSRIFYFSNAGRPEYYIGSADWMYRNLNNRVECITPVDEPALQQRLHQILSILLADRRQAWDMGPDGGYVQRQPDPDVPQTQMGTHEALMDLARRELRRSVQGE